MSSDRCTEKPGLLCSKIFLPTEADVFPCNTENRGAWVRTSHHVFIYVDGPEDCPTSACI